jgi:hypothetical protein
MASVPNLKQRSTAMQPSSPKGTSDTEDTSVVQHPSGKVKHGGAIQVLRCLLFVSFFIAGCFRYFHRTNIFTKCSNI